MNNKVKKVFPGGNTTKGFYSYYHYINKPNPVRNFILKGGPGAGKSNFMSEISREMQQRGYSIEEHYCSSSNGSLDAIVISDLKIAFMDGTAPHVIEPENPGAVDEIVNLGEFWDNTSLIKHRDEIVKTNSEVSKYFNRAFRYLKALDHVKNCISDVYSSSLNTYRFYQLKDALIKNIFSDVENTERLGFDRHYFGSAITPSGVVDYLETVVGITENIYYIKGHWGTGWSVLLSEIVEKAISLGFDVEVYHTPFEPELIEDIVIPNLNIALTTNEKFIDKCSSVIDLDMLVNKEDIKKYKKDLETDNAMCKMLLDKSIEQINKAKLLHDDLEEYYVSSMYFHSIDKKREDVVDQILKYTDKLIID